MEVDGFEAKTNLFLSWLSQMGVIMSAKAALVDLRTGARGRGVGEFCFYERVLLGSSNSCPSVLPSIICYYSACNENRQLLMLISGNRKFR